MKAARLHRLFNAESRRCFDIAIDHGFFNEAAFLAGIEDGRNIIQHSRPAAITRALMAMVHENASVADALRLLS